MKKPWLSPACAYVMLFSLVAVGLAGVAKTYVNLLPDDWQFIAGWAQTITVVALAVAFVAASIASMLSAAHAEKARAAGDGSRHIFWLALIYTAFCIGIEVTIGKLGARMLGTEVPLFALLAVLTFFAIAPRLVSYILAGMDNIASAEAVAKGEREHKQHIETIAATKAETEARIGAGAISLDAARKGGLGKVAGAGAAALLAIGMGVSQSPQASAQTPYVDASPETTQAAHGEDFDARLSVDGVWAKGPRAVNRETFEDAFNVVRENPDISSRQLAEEFGVTPKTAGRWKQWALAILGNEANADLLDELA